jgi:hypothetical protein
MGSQTHSTERLTMDNNVRQWLEQHHAYYEVSQSYVVIEDGHGSPSPSTRRVQAGFEVNIYGAINKNGPARWCADYEQGYTGIQDIFRERNHRAGSCSVEVIPFYSSLSIDPRNNFQPQTLIRLKVSHSRGLDQPAGPAEADALTDVEKQLQELGLRVGKPANF